MLAIASYVNQSVVVLTPDSRASSPFHLFFELERRYAEFRRISDAHSSRGSLTTKLLAGLQVVRPPRELIEQFDALVAPAVQRILCALRESHTLGALRDTLLLHVGRDALVEHRAIETTSLLRSLEEGGRSSDKHGD